MLKQLTIKNYALIDQILVQFHPGFNTITGETGAGKSVLLGGIGLILGKRADLGQIKDRSKKCIVEALIDIKEYDLEKLFNTYDLDYDHELIIRRELLSSGKSRAFVNDTPVNLDVLNTLGSRLIDIHSQNETLQLTSTNYLYSVVDGVANNHALLRSYKDQWLAYKNALREIDLLQLKQSEANKIQDYNAFLLNELNELKIGPDEYGELEEQQGQLENLEMIQQQLQFGHDILANEEQGIIDILKDLKKKVDNITDFGDVYRKIQERLVSVVLELEDLSNEIYFEQDKLVSDPQKLQEIKQTLQLVYDLQLKHGVQSIEELLLIRSDLNKQQLDSENLQDRIEACKNEKIRLENELNAIAGALLSNRKEAAPLLKDKLEGLLLQLGMPNAQIKIDINPSFELKANGKDELNFLFTANKGTDFKELKHVASGGELSRIMLALKSILAAYSQLPTLIFDEIDTGVSGEIAHKMGDIMKEMSLRFQLLSITHLPQIAAKGDYQYKVFKSDIDDQTQTMIKVLNNDERLEEIAKMLGGEKITDSAIAHAEQLLN
jgi:DNA repair protein RecN (Recombination protein N)